jgi:uncharacterized MnhB-related membrane protein
MIWEFELVLFVFLIFAAIVALEARNLLVSVVMLSVRRSWGLASRVSFS